jgi:DNA mismatch endonuclease (patch repair protein)
MPELLLRRAVHGEGYRYRLHVKNLPGSPDLVFPTRKKVIFVHGCFWHSHRKCRLGKLPKSNLRFWKPKLEGNRKRDRTNLRKLRRMGWQVLVVWQCNLRVMNGCLQRVISFLER